MSFSVRRLSPDEADASRQLGFEAFGVPTPPPTEPADLASRPGTSWFGAFDGDVLAARMADRAYDSYFGGAALSTAGIAGVTVAAEYRGQGLLTPLFTATLAAARERGALVSGLYPTAPRIYRRFGYEVVAAYETVEVPTAALGQSRGERSPVRRATSADVPGIRRVYDRWAAQHNGPLTRRGLSFPTTDEELLAAFTGVTVALDEAGEVCGYVSWQRGTRYGPEGVMEVSDLLADRPAAYRALLATLASFGSVTWRTRIDTSGFDVVRTFLDGVSWSVQDSSPYMIKVLDVAGALAARPYARAATADLEFAADGDVPEDHGLFRLEVSGGRADCTRLGASPADPSTRRLTSGGLALLFAGTLSSASLRTAGHLTGGDPDDDPDWDALFGGREQHIRDYY